MHILSFMDELQHKHICNAFPHTQLHTRIVNAHDPMHYCQRSAGCWAVNRRARQEERTVVKPALNYRLCKESKINFKTCYLHIWLKGRMRRGKCFIYIINFPFHSCVRLWKRKSSHQFQHIDDILALKFDSTQIWHFEGLIQHQPGVQVLVLHIQDELSPRCISSLFAVSHANSSD